MNKQKNGLVTQYMTRRTKRTALRTISHPPSSIRRDIVYTRKSHQSTAGQRILPMAQAWRMFLSSTASRLIGIYARSGFVHQHISWIIMYN